MNTTPLLYLEVKFHLYDATSLFHERLALSSLTAYPHCNSCKTCPSPWSDSSLFEFISDFPCSVCQVQCLCPQLQDTSSFSLSLFLSLLDFSHVVKLLLQMDAPQSLVHSFTSQSSFLCATSYTPKGPPRSCLLGIFPAPSHNWRKLVN